MKILPPQTLPPRSLTIRKHRPRPANHWTDYRQCLRWDFGFTCAFCLLHEADLYGGQSGEGLGGTTVEHATTRSEDPSHQNDYDNCLYACGFCNRSRSAKPRQHEAARLLDPTRDAWADHFESGGDRLQAREGNPDAEYTYHAYQLDDPRKIARREARRELVSDRLALLANIGDELTELLRLAEELCRRASQRLHLVLEAIRKLRSDARRALKELERYAAIPVDAQPVCRCPPPHDPAIPDEFERQLIEIPDHGL